MKLTDLYSLLHSLIFRSFLFCLITELLLSLANHAKVVTESVLFQKISTSHRKRCQNEQEGKDYWKVKCILNSLYEPKIELELDWNRINACPETGSGPVFNTSYNRPVILSYLFSSKDLKMTQINFVSRNQLHHTTNSCQHLTFGLSWPG